MRDLTILSAIVAVAVFVALCAGLGTGCYTCHTADCHDLPPMPEPVPPGPPAEGCFVVGADIDVDSGVIDDAGVWHYRARTFSEPCDASADR